jgi:molybdenum cofactor synthesis domain-containing protein
LSVEGNEPMTTHPDCCATDRGHHRTLSKQEAIDFLLGQVSPLADSETVRTDAGLGRVLAAPVTSAIDVPGWDNSAMDGYAIRHADLIAHGGLLRVAQRIPAGAVGGPLASGTAARIFTGAPVPEGAIGLLQGWGCAVVDLGIIPDTLDATTAALARAADAADLIVASGGVSVGEEDHLKPAVERLGTLDLWNIAIRPGKPVAFGRIGTTPFFGSPGNPVSLFVTCALFARPVVRRMQGIAGDSTPRTLKLRAGFDWPKPDKRREFHRARLRVGDDGEAEVEVFPSRSSAVLSSVAWADGFVELPPGQPIRRGERVDFIPFADLLD